MQQLSCSNGEAALPVAGVPNCRPGWLTRGGADARMVAEAVTKMVAGGRGSKRRRRKREGLQRGERKVHSGSRWSVGGFLWWS